MRKTSQLFKEFTYRIERCQSPAELKQIVSEMTVLQFPAGEKIALFASATFAAKYFDSQIKKGVVYEDNPGCGGRADQ